MSLAGVTDGRVRFVRFMREPAGHWMGVVTNGLREKRLPLDVLERAVAAGGIADPPEPGAIARMRAQNPSQAKAEQEKKRVASQRAQTARDHAKADAQAAKFQKVSLVQDLLDSAKERTGEAKGLLSGLGANLKTGAVAVGAALALYVGYRMFVR